jgi:hypothetical protein
MKTAQSIFSRILHVRYRCSELDSEFMITGISGNQAQAQLFFRGMVIPVSVYHHPGCLPAPGPVNFWFAGADVDPEEFVGGTGCCAVSEAQALPGNIQLGGAYPCDAVITTFTGIYVRTG